MRHSPLTRALPGALLAVLAAGCSLQPNAGAPGASPPSTGGSAATASSAGPAGPDSTPAPGARATPSTGGVRFGPTASGPLDGRTVVVDPGHNAHWITAINNKRTPVFGTVGARCNAIGATGLDKKTLEHTIVWEIAEKLVPLLRARGATVVLTRPDDNGVGPCNDERAEVANRTGASLLLSIHGDGAASTKLRGFSLVFAKHSAGGKSVLDASRAAAEKLLVALKGHTKIPPANYVGAPGPPIEQLDLGVLNNVKSVPAVLVETGNLIQADDWAILDSDAGRQGVAEGLAAGAVAILG